MNKDIIKKGILFLETDIQDVQHFSDEELQTLANTASPAGLRPIYARILAYRELIVELKAIVA
jgi:hypothetical protein